MRELSLEERISIINVLGAYPFKATGRSIHYTIDSLAQHCIADERTVERLHQAIDLLTETRVPRQTSCPYYFNVDTLRGSLAYVTMYNTLKPGKDEFNEDLLKWAMVGVIRIEKDQVTVREHDDKVSYLNCGDLIYRAQNGKLYTLLNPVRPEKDPLDAN